MNLTNKYSGLFTDQYQLSMAEGYFLTGRRSDSVNFDYFFRKNPFGSGFTIFAGLQDLFELILDFKFDQDAIDFLHKRGFHSDFLDYLKDFQFQGTIYAPKEGEVIFPTEPVVSVEGTIIECQLLETVLLNTLNFQSLIATKANRLRHSAGDRTLMEFGMRRAQGWAVIHGSRAAVIGGVDSTSNVLSAYLYGLESSGTQAHSWIQSFEDELTAFRKFAETRPKHCVLLVDTYHTLNSGVPNAIIVAKEMAERGEQLSAIRLDSGDLAYLSKKARKMLDDAGLKEVKIMASNRLDEYIIKSLIDQGAKIDGFGVGGNLITGQKDGALDGVYKLSQVNHRHTIKLSEDVYKRTLPGKKKIVRYYNDDDKFYADAIVLAEENVADIATIYHPQYTDKKSIVTGLKSEVLISKVFEKGKALFKEKGIHEISEYRKLRVSQLTEDHKRFEFPHRYKVGLSESLIDLRDTLISDIKNK
ncbi:Nicotinate phosphoribosyltransferase [Arenibacter antarcticus]|uniref:Nicotinate phosphoribosyltransferase n=1 Tax=Arenibacter antarcticus TaxID=2040469 RepID=A0ABW5VIB7_9FLAO|nr:nicotinate phosphoribosyltransferase [Arenibacter sp. H213]MCM4166516.1 nicotinate phosphoribosyltransferase [Arenibacter sp. H213]